MIKHIELTIGGRDIWACDWGRKELVPAELFDLQNTMDGYCLECLPKAAEIMELKALRKSAGDDW